MADNLRFGAILHDARENAGEDLVSVARRIRIRPDILECIEDSDLASMPPRGYSRNMINAYARYLGLNPTEIVKMYLDAQHEFQLESARSSIRPSGINMDSGRTRRERRAEADTVGVGPSRASHRNGAFDELFPSYDEAGGRAYGGGGYGSSGAGAYASRAHVGSSRDALAEDPLRGASFGSADSTRRIGSVHVGSYNGYGDGLSRWQARSVQDAGSTRAMAPVRERRSVRASSGRMDGIYAGASSSAGGFLDGWRDRLPFIVAGVAILLLIVLVAVVVRSLGAPAQPEQQTTMNITGLPEAASSSDSSDSSSASTASSSDAATKPSAPAEAAPTKTTIEFSVADGQTAYVEVYEGTTLSDGGAPTLAQTLTGPYSSTYDVDSVLQFTTTNPDAITLTQDGKKVSFEENASGVYTVTFKFADVLAAWNEAHGGSNASASSADASTSGSGKGAA